MKIGNPGSLIGTEAGWLALSHCVGPMRRYCLGAFLLDIEDPARIIGRLRKPLLAPNERDAKGMCPTSSAPAGPCYTATSSSS